MNQQTQDQRQKNTYNETFDNKFGLTRTKILGLSITTLLLLALTAGLFFGPALMASEAEEKAAPPAMPPMPVETTEVKVANSEQTLSAIGSLQSEESVVIATEIAGRITHIGFDEGSKVKTGKLLVQLDNSVLQAELDRAMASRNLSAANYKRAEALLQDRAVSERERDGAYAQWQLDEATVRLTQAQLDKTRILAPFNGNLGLRRVSVGDYVQPGQHLINLEAIRRLKAEFDIPERSISEVKVGQMINLTSDAYPGRDFTGKVYAIDPQIDESSRSLKVRALLDNSDRALLPGQFVKIALSVATTENALFIPEQALIPQPKVKLVFKVVDGTAQMVPVQTGSRVKGWVEITSGLQPGDVVVTGGHQKIGPGSPVHAIPADPAMFAKI